MYLLVTNWKGYWDNIGHQTPYYPSGLVNIATNTIVDNANTVFIKIDGTRRILKGWHGTIHSARTNQDRLFFEISLESEIPHNEFSNYEGYGPGFYEIETNHEDQIEETNLQLMPPFFNNLSTITNPFEFEDLVYKLLRVMGIHRSYQFSKDGQAGRADGFFKFLNFAVIYDCTLAENYFERKRQQIINFSDQLLNGAVEIPPNIIERVQHFQKQVWIITRGTSQILQNIGGTGIVTVKEISIHDLKELYKDRLLVSLSEDEFENKLRNLGQY